MRYAITTMKKFLVCLTVSAFACISAVQAGEANSCDKSKAACADQAKAKAAECASACATACSGAKVAKKKVDQSVKGATLLVMR
jgi:hypothetical protein